MAYPVLIIAQQEIAARIDVLQAIEVVEAAFRDYERGEDILPEKLIFKVPGGVAACMASMLPGQNVLAMKLGQGREQNPRRGLPNIISQISLFDPDTGARDLAIPETLLRSFGHADCGVYGEVIEAGEIAAGNELHG